MQPCDFTTLIAAAAELRADWLPARVEQIFQRDRTHLYIALRTIDRRGWLTLSWHSQAARVCIGEAPPKEPDTFTFSDQLRHQIKGLALVEIATISPWERVLDFQFSRRPGDPILWHLYAEIMGKYSNVILANGEGAIVTAAHQVTADQSSVRPILTGQPYTVPPTLTDPIPSLQESRERWQERVSLIPGTLRRNLLTNYRGLSSALVVLMAQAAGIDANRTTESLTELEWQNLFHKWKEWLHILEAEEFKPGWTETGYTVLGWGMTQPAETVGELLDRYYGDRLNEQEFKQLRHQLAQKLKSILAKLQVKQQTFRDRLQQSDKADIYRQQADLLMAYLHEWQPGMKQITLNDFETEEAIVIPLNPEKNAVQNAQALYKSHQKLKRARLAVEPLLREVNAEIYYLEQVESALDGVAEYCEPGDLIVLEEIRDELIDRGYLNAPQYRRHSSTNPNQHHFSRYTTPSGFELLVGRNNQQNDRLTFRIAGDYDLWFHTQEIPGSHVLMRLDPGSVPDDADLQFAADVATYYSRANQSDRAPVVYTEPKHLYKPKGAEPGIVVYKHERILWGEPQKFKTQKNNRM
ncbi:MAG TPA: NFACT family protein [Oscillatoriales cyanobacterium M59_W2019_021]|nr:NFACT family protein [Oscillatoriales cyanobacterium M4454_W2019_049]HIK53063.1 NFACT family protein [Oscillatoriales cyanobacterium M59_W2019_021]